jgi:phosphate/sulfate permease
MTPTLAALYDISLGIHQLCGLGLILLAVAITVISVMARNEIPLLKYGLQFKVVAYPLFTIVVITGIYQLIHLHEKLFQVWVIGAAALGIGYMGTLDGTWAPLARKILGGEVEGEELKKTQGKTIILGVAMLVMIIAATGMMESTTG